MALVPAIIMGSIGPIGAAPCGRPQWELDGIAHGISGGHRGPPLQFHDSFGSQALAPAFGSGTHAVGPAAWFLRRPPATAHLLTFAVWTTVALVGAYHWWSGGGPGTFLMASLFFSPKRMRLSQTTAGSNKESHSSLPPKAWIPRLQRNLRELTDRWQAKGLIDSSAGFSAPFLAVARTAEDMRHERHNNGREGKGDRLRESVWLAVSV